MAAGIKSGGQEVTIGGLSKKSGCHIETIRYYERIGLMPAPARTASGRRLYAQGDLRRLRFIRRSRELGFSVDEIRGLLALVEGGHYTCGEVLEKAKAHLADIRRRMADLERMERALEAMAAECRGGETPRCAIIEELAGGRNI